MNILDHFSESLETVLRVRNTSNLFCGSGTGIETFGSGIKIPDPQHWMQRLHATGIVSH
jgi:hypothetical protein